VLKSTTSFLLIIRLRFVLLDRKMHWCIGFLIIWLGEKLLGQFYLDKLIKDKILKCFYSYYRYMIEYNVVFCTQ